MSEQSEKIKLEHDLKYCEICLKEKNKQYWKLANYIQNRHGLQVLKEILNDDK